MIIYFADREMRILGHATTELREGYVIIEDLKTDDVETGVASFNCGIGFNESNRAKLEEMTCAGNYLLRSNDGENEFYTIIDSEVDTKNQHIYIYAEDAGLDLLNERADAFEADKSQLALYYINKYIVDSGFEIGVYEIPNSVTRKLKWESESSVTERLASIATQFGGYEISYSFAIKGLEVTHKYINFRKQRGKDEGVQLRLNKEVDRIITTKTVANLATAFVCEGAIPDDAEKPITLKGYKYDDGDFYVDSNGKLKSRKAVAKWSRYVWNKEPNQLIRLFVPYVATPLCNSLA
jgi:phage minor structural protein